MCVRSYEHRAEAGIPAVFVLRGRGPGQPSGLRRWEGN